MTSETPSARERLISTSYELFTHRGIGDVGVDEVVARAGVAKATLYRHFPSKDDLVLAFMDRRAEMWTTEVIDRQPTERTKDPKEQLLAMFDVLDEWFHRRSDYEACSFVKVLFEVGAQGRVGKACITHLDNIRDILRERAERAGLRDAKEFAWSLNILLKGSIVCAAEGDVESARRAKPIAARLIEEHTADHRARGG
ncbi:TetR/AcrR family transcriptional regulator [Mycobacterium sp. 852002-51961_SCH5331710]|uniref:TetR/AcrR family transcriptional regulator n=1 Tax=Mycobacterium sp. 852002-51961_SCH5331710 TaxID=1834105 RepID=UPI0007FBFA97|nr:TetR/AcrR family transcriptional regulator [Mycobacterium sp. 852002-51961_SCH5331710]OBB35722.1 TetR family transcriptional regulator [Mycobacterium sp. 852002-51961_SCH5331710]